MQKHYKTQGKQGTEEYKENPKLEMTKHETGNRTAKNLEKQGGSYTGLMTRSNTGETTDDPTQDRGKHTLYIHTQGNEGNAQQEGDTAEPN